MLESEQPHIDFIGEIRTLHLGVRKTPKFRVWVDIGNQMIKNRRLYIPGTVVTGMDLNDGNDVIWLLNNNKYGLMRVPNKVIAPQSFVIVRWPLRSDRNPYIPIESILRRIEIEDGYFAPNGNGLLLPKAGYLTGY